MKGIVLCLGMLMNLCSCKYTAQTTQVDVLDYKIDLDQSKVYSVQDIFSKIEIIPLRTPDSLVFSGMNFILCKNNIFFWEQRQHQVLCFDLQGNYRYTINSRGRGPREYTAIHGIYADPFNDQLMILDFFSGILRYDFSGKFMDKIKFPKGVFVNHFAMINKDTLFCIEANANDNQKKVVNFFDLKERKIVGSWYVEDPVYLVNSDITQNQNSTYYCIAKEPYVYDVSATEPVVKYHFDFGKYNYDWADLAIPQVDKADMKKVQLRWIYKNCPWFLQKFVERKNYFYVSLLAFFKGDFERKVAAPVWHIFWNRRDSTYKVIDRFKEGTLLFGFLSFTDDAIYTAVEKSYVEENIPLDVLTPESRQILEGLPEDANPVMIKYSLK